MPSRKIRDSDSTILVFKEKAKLFTSETNFPHCISSLPPLPSLLFLWGLLPTEECILQAREIGPAGERTKIALFITSSVLLVLLLGAAVVVWRKSRGRVQPVAKAGYEKLGDPSKSYVSYKSSHRENTSFEEDQVTEYRDRDYDEDEDDDIVYMGQDGTVYRKFKYGLLDEEGDELEYDDESYSYQ